MAKITRYNGNYAAFASASTSFFRTVFGGTTQSDTLDDNINSDYFLGWEKVTDSEIPPREWFNAVAYTISHTLAYTHQMGVAEWNVSQEYHEGSTTSRTGHLYISQTNTNVGNDPATDDVNWKVVALIEDLENASSIIYDNATSGLISTTVQGAIDELRDADNILYDDTDTSLGSDVQAALDALYTASRIPSGAVQNFAMSTAPSGWLKADGSEISRATYNDLFTAIGTTFGAGDGSLTFNLPDLRGEFIRGFDDGRGIDTGRVFGSSQDDALEDHSHYSGVSVQSGEIPGYAGAGYTTNELSAIRRATGQDTNPAVNGITSGVIDSGVTVNSPVLGATSDAKTPADETRSRNIALLTCIKI